MSLFSFVSTGRKLVPDKYRNKNAVFAVICLAVSLDNLNVAGTLTTSYSIAEHFGASTSTVSWVVSAYALTLGSFIILFGKFADMFGPDNVFLFGVFNQALFALLCAIPQPSVEAMIVFRALQGIGGAALMPSGFGLAAHYFMGPGMEGALRLLGIVVTSSFSVGAVLGGAFSLTSIGYQSFFYFSAASAALFFVLLFFFIIPVERNQAAKDMHLRDLDFPGVFCLVVGLLLIIFGLTESAEGWNSPKVYIPIPIGGVLFIGMVLFETLYLTPIQNTYQQNSVELEKSSDSSDSSDDVPQEVTQEIDPESHQHAQTISGDDWRVRVQLLFPAAVLRIRNFLPFLVSLFVIFMNYISTMYAIIEYHLYVEGNTPLLASVKILPLGAGLTFGCLIYREKWAHKIGIKWLVMLSALLVLGTVIWVSRIDYRIHNDFWKFDFASLFIMGYAVNLFFMIYLNSVMAETPLHLQGVVAGIFLTFGQIGVAIGGAVFSTVVGNVTAAVTPEEVLALHEKFRTSFYLPIAGSALFVLMSFTIKNPKKN